MTTVTPLFKTINKEIDSYTHEDAQSLMRARDLMEGLIRDIAYGASNGLLSPDPWDSHCLKEAKCRILISMARVGGL